MVPAKVNGETNDDNDDNDRYILGSQDVSLAKTENLRLLFFPPCVHLTIRRRLLLLLLYSPGLCYVPMRNEQPVKRWTRLEFLVALESRTASKEQGMRSKRKQRKIETSDSARNTQRKSRLKNTCIHIVHTHTGNTHGVFACTISIYRKSHLAMRKTRLLRISARRETKTLEG